MRRIFAFILFNVYICTLAYACDMSALVMKRNVFLSHFTHLLTDGNYTDYDLPQDYLAFVMNRSMLYHRDGYGIIAYVQGRSKLTQENYWYKRVTSNTVNQVYYTGNYFNYNQPADVFDNAYREISTGDYSGSIIMCHARSASANPLAPGNHPFRMEANNRTCSLMHNGFVSTSTRNFMINEIYARDFLWFTEHKPNYTDFPNYADPAYWIDTEVLFNFLMCEITAYDYDVLSGLRSGLQKLTDYMKLSTNVVNFIFSDGQSIYVFRSTPVTGINSNYRISYKYDPRGFFAVRTGYPSATETQLQKSELAVFNTDGTLSRYPNILSDQMMVPSRSGHDQTLTRTVSFPAAAEQIDISISFYLEEPANVKINVFNLKGQLVRNIADGVLQTGNYRFKWDGNDRSGRRVARGLYYLEIIKGGERHINKISYFR